MITASSRQLDAVAAQDRQVHWRVFVDDAAGSPVEWTSWVRSFEVRADINELVMRADISFFREEGATSLSPLVGSPANIDAGRDVTIDVAVVDQANTLEAADWQSIFSGSIDDVAFGGTESVVTVPCRGLGGQLVDRFLKTPTVFGSPDGTRPVETVFVDVLDEVFGEGVIELDVDGDPDLGIFETPFDRQAVNQILQSLVDLNGWMFGYRWSEAYQTWRLKLFEPDRTQTTPDHTFGPSDYREIPDISVSTVTVRNEVEILWDADEDSVVVIDSSSQAEFGERYMFIDLSDDIQIDTLAKATTLGAAVLADTARPPVEQAAILQAFPFVELGDLYRFTANDVHYDSDQDMAVTSYVHRGDASGLVTTVTTRATPSGGDLRWFRKKLERDRAKTVRTNAPDATPTPKLGPAIEIGFDDAKKARVSVTASESDQLAGVVMAMAVGSEPSALASVASVQLSAAEDAGQTSLSVASSAASLDDHWALIRGGGNAEMIYIRIGGSSSVTIATPGLQSAYPEGAIIEAFGIDRDIGGAGFDGPSGTVVADNTELTGTPDIDVSVGELLYVRAAPILTSGAIGPQTVASRRRMDVEFVVPRVDFIALRSGTDVSVEFTIEDPSLALSSEPGYKEFDGDDQTFDVAFNTTWDTETGTPGTNPQIVRKVTVTDPTTKLKFEASYTNENGDTETIGGDVDLASVQEVELEVAISPAAFQPESEATKWKYDTLAAEGLIMGCNDTSDTLHRYFADVPAVPGTLLTNIAYRSSGESAADQVDFVFRHRNTILSSSSTGDTSSSYTDHSDTLNHTVVAEDYVLELTIKSDGPGAFAAGVATTVLTYNSPTQKQRL